MYLFLQTNSISDLSITEVQTEVIGDTSTISCVVTKNSKSPTSFTWSYSSIHDGSSGTISDNNDYTIINQADSSALLVKSVAHDTPNQYTCTVAWGDTEFTAETKITVIEFEVDETAYGFGGQNTVIPCSYESHTAPPVSLKIQKSVNSAWVDQSGTSQVSGNIGTGSLTVATPSGTSGTVSEQYRCVVEDASGNKYTSDIIAFDVVGKFQGRLWSFLTVISQADLRPGY